MHLRLLTQDDAPAFQALTDDPVIAGIISFLSYPIAADFAQGWIAKNTDTANERVYGAFAGDTLLGYIGSHDGSGGIEIGYWVGTAHTGRGVASFMVRELIAILRADGSDRTIFAECLPSNTGSWRVLKKSGFTDTKRAGHREGRMRLEFCGI